MPPPGPYAPAAIEPDGPDGPDAGETAAITFPRPSPMSTPPAVPVAPPPPSWHPRQQPTGAIAPWQPPPAQQWTPAPAPAPYPPPPWGPTTDVPPQRRSRRGLVITSVVLGLVVLLCGGGGLAAFLLLRDVDTAEGAASPVVAVERFMEAVYKEQNASLAAATVCRDARKADAIDRKVEEVKNYAKAYQNPQFEWAAPKVDEQDAEHAIVSVDLRMTTADDRSAEQQLRFTVVQQTGWWVCEVA
jgi:hypothetical protein